MQRAAYAALTAVYLVAVLSCYTTVATRALLDASDISSFFALSSGNVTSDAMLLATGAQSSCLADATQQVLLRLQRYEQDGEIRAQPDLLSTVMTDVLNATLLPCLDQASTAPPEATQNFQILVEDRAQYGYTTNHIFQLVANWLQSNRHMQVEAVIAPLEALLPSAEYPGPPPAPRAWVTAGSMLLLVDTLWSEMFLDAVSVVSSPLARWEDDVFPAVRKHIGTYRGMQYAIPIDGKILMVFYHAKAVEALGGQLPSTWQQLMETARTLNGTVDYDGDGTPDYAICATTTLNCTPVLWPSYIAASLISTGTLDGQGVFFNPRDGSPLVNNHAMRYALEYWRELQAFVRASDPSNSSEGSCSARPTDFITGQCGIMLGVSVQFQDIQAAVNSTARGSTVSARIPGSTQVLNRGTNTLENCTAANCPLAEAVQDPVTGVTVLVNRPTVLFADNMVMTIRDQTPAARLADVAFAAGIISTSEAGVFFAQSRMNGLSPYRNSQLNPNIWVSGLGAHLEDTTSYIQATNASMQAPHVVTDLWLPGLSTRMRDELSTFTAGHATWRTDTDRIMMLMEATLNADADAWGRQLMLQLYRGLINYQPPPPPPPPLPPPKIMDGGFPGFPPLRPLPPLSASNSSLLHVLTNIVTPVLAGLLLLFLSVLCAVVRAYARRVERRKRTPPPAGDDTTLLVTDIQGSTTLWEALPPGVMDLALKEHHTLLRKLLLRHCGYESATEGDSFLLAFHCAQDAVMFAMDAQRELLAADWPAGLLEHELCAEVFAASGAFDPVQRGVDVRQLQLHAAMAACEGSIPCPAAPAQERMMPAHASVELCETINQAEQPKKREATGRGSLDGGRGIQTWLEKLELALVATVHGPARGHTAECAAESYAQEHAVHHSSRIFAPEQRSTQQQTKRPDGSVTFSLACSLAYQAVSPSSSGQPCSLIFRGLRVRMGMSSGVEEEGVVAEGSRVQYSGASMDFTKALADCGHGGMVMVSQSSFRRLPMPQLWQQLAVLDCGLHCVKEGTEPVTIYQVLSRCRRFRAGHLAAIKTKSQHALGVLDAPLGNVAIVFMYPVGVNALLAWNADVTRQAIRLLHEAASKQLHLWGGCQVEAADSLMLMAFSSSSDAIMCCLELQRNCMLHIDWPDELLSHELCEQLVVSMPQVDGQLEDRVVMRGLRIKMGMDHGAVLGSLHPMTGCIQYRGKVMNRAARIASAAASGQVLCSAEVWREAGNSEVLLQNGVDGESTGLYQLKGLPEKLELFSCRYHVASQMAPRTLQRRGGMAASLGSSHRNTRTVSNQPLSSTQIPTHTSIPVVPVGGADAQRASTSGSLTMGGTTSDNSIALHEVNITVPASMTLTLPGVPPSYPQYEARTFSGLLPRLLAVDRRSGSSTDIAVPALRTTASQMMALLEGDPQRLAPMSAEEMLKREAEGVPRPGLSNVESWWRKGTDKALGRSGSALPKQTQQQSPSDPALSEWEEMARERDVVQAVQPTSSPERSTQSRGHSNRSSMAFYSELDMAGFRSFLPTLKHSKGNEATSGQELQHGAALPDNPPGPSIPPGAFIVPGGMAAAAAGATMRTPPAAVDSFCTDACQHHPDRPTLQTCQELQRFDARSPHAHVEAVPAAPSGPQQAQQAHAKIAHPAPSRPQHTQQAQAETTPPTPFSPSHAPSGQVHDAELDMESNSVDSSNSPGAGLTPPPSSRTTPLLSAILESAPSEDNLRGVTCSQLDADSTNLMPGSMLGMPPLVLMSLEDMGDASRSSPKLKQRYTVSVVEAAESALPSGTASDVHDARICI